MIKRANQIDGTLTIATKFKRLRDGYVALGAKFGLKGGDPTSDYFLVFYDESLTATLMLKIEGALNPNL